MPGANGRIAYVQAPEGQDSEIFTVLPDGTDAQRLTDTAASELDPSWSADGQSIAYITISSDAKSTIFVMDADGGNVREIAHSGVAASPSFSPDGRRIVYAARRGIRTVAVDGSDRQRLITGNPDGGLLGDPSYSPDGRGIVFYGAPKGTTQSGIWTIRSDGSRLRRLTRPRPNYDYFPDYSPDGRQIVFVRGPSGGPARIRLMNADGSKRRAIPGTYGFSYPAFSPAGDRVAMSSSSGSSFNCTDLFTITPVGSDSRQVTQNCGTGDGSDGAFSPSWQPLP